MSPLAFLQKRVPEQPGIQPVPITAKPKPNPKPTVGPPNPLTTTISLPGSISSAVATTRTTVATTHNAATSTAPSYGLESSDAKPSEPGNANNSGLIIGILLGVVVVFAVAAGLFFRRRRNKRRGDEVRQAELYQQQRMMRDNQSGSIVASNTRHQHHRGGSSLNGLMTGSLTKHSSEEGGDVSGYHGQNSVHREQPEWWGKKSPLEYYRQVPPLKELAKNEDTQKGSTEDPGRQGQGQDVIEVVAAKSLMNSAGQQGSSSGRDSFPLHPANGVNDIRRNNNNSLYPSPQNHRVVQPQYRQQPRQYEQRPHQESSSRNRLSSIPPISPMGSVYSAMCESDGHQQQPSQKQSIIIYQPPPPMLPNSNPYYRPPPPANTPDRSQAYAAISSLSPQPSAGFYEALESQQLIPRILPTTPSSVPPPIPRATRPISIISTGIFADAGDAIGNASHPSSSSSSIHPEQSTFSTLPPSSPTSSSTSVPAIDMQAAGSGTPLTPKSPSGSEMSGLSAGEGPPRMGGRQARVKAKRRTLDMTNGTLQ